MKTVFFIALTFSTYYAAVSQSTPVLKFRDGTVWVTGLGSTSIAEDQWKEFLRVYTHDAFVKRINQPVSGTYHWHGDSLSFAPTFGFAAGERYHVVFGKLELVFSIPEETVLPTVIETIHPQANLLPENMLRMYISFSAPMMPGEAYEHISLFTANGTLVDKAFLIIDQELWDAERKRFTLLFDPGRVKRGIQSNLELGAPLQAGEHYRLVIDSGWRDVHGNFLKSSYTKTFTVTKAARTKLSLADWKIVAPTADSRENLVLYTDRPIDHALAMKCITIRGTHGRVSGRATLINSTVWQFTPDQPWQANEYHVEVLPHLEDVAGNNFNNAFDIDLSQEGRSNSSEAVRFSFVIRSWVK